MLCPYCGHSESKVIDSRDADGKEATRRRRECMSCEKRFTTYERVEKTARLVVVKKNGSRSPFDVAKVLAGIQAACGKRPVSEVEKQRLARAIDESLHREFEREVESHEIGVRVARGLRRVDRVAALRFASELYDFKGLEDFLKEAEDLQQFPEDLPDQPNLFEEDGPSSPDAPA
ncbi:MAG: transcriptional regulator NrdR [Planctomycetota bacterium]|nr:transcriptional regulator NrdR [Planctomycetota bacterium]